MRADNAIDDVGDRLILAGHGMQRHHVDISLSHTS
jgi:hypothetical protein